MRSLYIPSLIALAVGLLLSQSVDAKLQPKTNLELYLENEIILIGKIISTEQFSKQGYTKYDINVERYLKNPQPTDNVTAFGGGTDEFTRSVEKVFDKGDRVFLLLNGDKESYQISLYSVWAKSFNPDLDFIISPFKLYKSGIPVDDIVCKSMFVLVQKLADNSPVCIKPGNIEKLIATGWLGSEYEKLY